jgi:protein-tyrosine-phosphatase
MAEALLNRADSEHFVAVSAGTDRAETYPLTTSVMKEIGVDFEGRVPRAVSEVRDLSFDFVITLCDRARSEGAKFSGAEVVHWQFPDVMATTDPGKQERLLRSLRDQIAQRVRLFALVQTRSTTMAPRTEQGRDRPRDLVHS